MSVISFEAEKNYKIAYDMFFYEEDIKGALALAKSILKSAKNHIKTLKLLGKILILQDDIPCALDVLEKIKKINGDDFELNLQFAYCFQSCMEYSLADKYCAKCLELVNFSDFEKLKALYFLRADLLLGKSKIGEVLKVLNEAKKILPQEDYLELASRYELDLNLRTNVVEFSRSKKVL